MFPRKLFLYILKVLYIISTFQEKVNTLKYKSKQVLNTREMALDKNQLRKWIHFYEYVQIVNIV